jgi:hypothetical protein
MDEGVAPTPGSCTVLSFGINNEWSFDDAMEEYGCDVSFEIIYLRKKGGK